MTTAVVLALYAVLLATVGAKVLARARWVDRAPRLGIAAWQALSASVLLAATFAALALTVPSVRVSGGLAGLLAACVMALRSQYAAPAGTAAAAAGALLVAALVGRLSWCVVIEYARVVRWRRRHRAALGLVGRCDPQLDAMVVEHSTPVAYCIPGRKHRIVLTTGALASLDQEQLSAVLAHERAHLHGHHHLATAAALALARAFPRVPAFSHAGEEIVRLVELAADDAATQATDRLSLAEALLRLGTTSSPARAAASLAATGPGAAARVRRLIGPPTPPGRVITALTLVMITVAMTAPVVVAAAPAVTTTGSHCCPGDPAGPAFGMTRCAGSGVCAPDMGAVCSPADCGEYHRSRQ